MRCMLRDHARAPRHACLTSEFRRGAFWRLLFAVLNPVATAGVKWRTRDIAPQIAYFNSLLSHPAIFDHLLSRTDSNNVLAKVCNGLVKSSLMDSPCSIFAVLCLCQSLSTTFADSKYGKSRVVVNMWPFCIKVKKYIYLPAQVLRCERWAFGRAYGPRKV